MSYDLGTAHGTIELEYKGKGATQQAEKDMDGVDKKSKKTDNSLKKLGATLGKLGQGAKIGAIASGLGIAAAQAASLGVQILGIIPNLVSIASLSAALPAIYTSVAASVAVLKLAFSGVGDAIKAAFDPKKSAQFEESIKELAPAAQSFVRAIQSSVPQLKEFQKGIQQTFFQASFLTGAVREFMDILRQVGPQLKGLAGDFGEITRRVVNFAVSADSITFFEDSVKSARAALAGFSSQIVPVLIGLRAVGTVGMPLMVQLGNAIGVVAGKFAAWLKEIAANGQLQEWIDTAIATLKTLGEIVKNVGSLLFSIIQAANAVGGGLLNTLAEITGQFAAFAKSAEGSAALRDLFASIMSVAKQLSPVLTTLVGALAKALAPALQQIATQVGPVLLDVVKRLAPAFGPLAKAIADLIGAVAPLLPPIAELVSLLAQYLAGAVTNLVAELGPLIQVLAGALLKTFETLAPVVLELAKNALPIAAEAGVALAKAFVPLVPTLIKVAQTFADAIIPQLPELTKASLKLIPAVIQLVDAFVQLVNQGLNALVPLIPPLVDLFVQLAPALTQIAIIGVKILTWVLQFATFMQGFPQKAAAFENAIKDGIVGALKSVWNAITSFGGMILGWFQKLPGLILGALKALPGLIGNLFKNALNGAATIVGFTAGLIVGFFTKLVPRILNAIVNLPSTLLALFQRAMTAAIGFLSAGINTIVTFFSNLPKRIKSALSSLGAAIVNVARSAFNSFRGALSSGASSAVGFMRNLPGRLKSALGNLGSLLLNAGKSIINGLYNGIQSGIGRVLGAVSGLADRVKGAFNDALKIFSPSKVFFESGVNIDEGVILGLQKKMKDVEAVANTLAQTIIQPTISLPNASGMALATVPALPTIKQQAVASQTGASTFGPYNLQIDKDTLVSFTIDAITGNPIVVAKSAAEGDRQKTWNGSGRAA